MPVRHRPTTSRRTAPEFPAPPTPGSVLLLTDDDDLAAAVDRLAAAAGCTLRRACAPTEQVPDLVLLGTDVGPVRPPLPPTVEVVVVGRAPVAPQWWADAAVLDPAHALLLPEGQDWLLERLSDAAEGLRCLGPVIAVVGGAGGAGASVLAAGLGRAMADTVGECLLVDADPGSGGLDLLVGGDALPGLRWGDLAGVQGRLNPPVLRTAVELGAGLHVLPTARSGAGVPAPDQLWTVVDAARRSFAGTVVDLPRGDLARWAPVLGACAEVLVVIPGTTRGAAAGALAVAELVALRATEVRVVVRDVGAGVDPEDVAQAAGAELAGVVGQDRDLDAVLERGEGVPGGRRSALRAFALSCARDHAAGVPTDPAGGRR